MIQNRIIRGAANAKQRPPPSAPHLSLRSQTGRVHRYKCYDYYSDVLGRADLRQNSCVIHDPERRRAASLADLCPCFATRCCSSVRDCFGTQLNRASLSTPICSSQNVSFCSAWGKTIVSRRRRWSWFLVFVFMDRSNLSTAVNVTPEGCPTACLPPYRGGPFFAQAPTEDGCSPAVGRRRPSGSPAWRRRRVQ